MEVKNGIIIDGVLHEAVNYSNDSSCSICSLRKECDELENRCDEWICRLIDCKYFVALNYALSEFDKRKYGLEATVKIWKHFALIFIITTIVLTIRLFIQL